MAAGGTHGDTAPEWGHIIEGFIGNIELVIQQINDGEYEREEQADFNIKTFWSKMEMAFKALSHEATKLSMAFSSPPCPDNKVCESLMSSMEKVTLALLSVFYTLPKSQGICLKKMVKSSVLGILDDVKCLAETIKSYGAGSQEQLQNTGKVWRDSDLLSNLPQDNKEAVVKVLQQSFELVKDALHEMQEAIDGDCPDRDLAEALGLDIENSNNEDTWTEKDKALMGPCLGLIKTSQSLLKKSKETINSRGCCNSSKSVAEFDDLADCLDKISPSVDDLAFCLYPPVNYDTVHENAKKLYTIHIHTLDIIRKSHYCSEDDQKWIEFILKANQHNWENVKQYTDNVT